MKEQKVDLLIDNAHNIFNATSIYDVIDLDNRQEAETFLIKRYNNPDKISINRYLDIVEKIRNFLNNDSTIQ